MAAVPPVSIDLALARICLAACDAAYDFDPAERAKALADAGLAEVTYLQEAVDARALLCSKDGQLYLAFQGTQFTTLEIQSIVENLKVDPVDIGGGRQVTDGFWQQLTNLLPACVEAVAGRPCIVTGHSMGGTIAHMSLATPLFVTAQAVVSFGAPKTANQAFWQSVDTSRLTRLVNESDFAPIWPLFPQEWVQPETGEWWLHGGGMQFLAGRDARPVPTDSVGDHMLPAYAKSLGVVLG
jgi:hypothetical protein